MYICVKELFLENRSFKEGVEIPAKLVNNRLLRMGIVRKVPDVIAEKLIELPDEVDESFSTEEILTDLNEVVKDLSDATELLVDDSSTVETITEEKQEPVFNLEYAQSLYSEDNKSESKDALESYGELFGVDLKKNKSFEHMLESLVEFINS